MKRIVLSMLLLAGGAAPAAEIPVRVTGSRVNLRARPGLTYEVVGQADVGDVLLAKTFQTEWVEVIPPPGTRGYVYAPMVEENLVAVAELNVRCGPGVHFSPMGVMRRNMVVEERGRHGEDWLEIDATADCSLWVSAEYVEPVRLLVQPVPSPATPGPAVAPGPALAAEARPAGDPVSGPEPAYSRLPASLHPVASEPQGRAGELSGELRKTLPLDRRPLRFRVVRVAADSVTTLGYLHGNEPQLTQLLGRVMTVRGPSFRVQEYREPVLIPEQIVLQARGQPERRSRKNP